MAGSGVGTRMADLRTEAGIVDVLMSGGQSKDRN